MRIIFSPSLCGSCYIGLDKNCLAIDNQVVETQGLLTQLGLHAGIHQEIPTYAERLADYHQALMEYDETYPDNIFHRSISIDSMSVAKTLLRWRDALSLAGWNRAYVGASNRLDALAFIETNYEDKASDIAVLLLRLERSCSLMASGDTPVPSVYKDLDISVTFPEDLLPDYLIPLFKSLKQIVKSVEFGTVKTEDMPQKMEIIRFSQQYMAEAWLSQQNASDYDVWINTDNKRLDNWLHMSGRPVSGSDMLHSNPQITQMFLLAIQLFQRPLNVNTFLQYLYLPECPLPWEFTFHLACTIVSEGGFSNEKVLKVVSDYLDNECNEKYRKYLPFDLRDDKQAKALADESDAVSIKKLTAFLKNNKSYVGNRSKKISAMRPNDMRIAQLQQVSSLVDALLKLLPTSADTISFTTLQQWAQSLYDTCDFKQYNAQVGSQFVVSNPSNIVGKTKRTIWCDFYGDRAFTLSSDFLSPREIEVLSSHAIRLWNPEKEKAYLTFAMETPLHMTTDKLTFVVCDKQGETILPTHPQHLQLPEGIQETNGDELFHKLPSVPVEGVDNHRENDATEVTFNAKDHHVSWRKQESFSALEKLLQNPLDYFMNYILGFSDLGPTEIKMSLTNGNVAHEVIEDLFTADRGEMSLTEYVRKAYNDAFQNALVRKGALLLLPEHHLDLDKLRYQLTICVNQLAEIIQTNRLTVIRCEQEELQDLGIQDGIMIKGYIDMLLRDTAGKDVIFDLKWTSQKDKHEKLIQKNRASQLAIYRAMLQQHGDHPQAARTAFFVMPLGKIVSADEFLPEHFIQVTPQNTDDIMQQLRNGYEERRKEISDGKIETSDLMPVADLEYANTNGVFPLEVEGKNNPKKAENKFSDYKCFTI